MSKWILAAVLAISVAGIQGTAVAQDSKEHPTVSTPDEAKQKAETKDQQIAPKDSQQTGSPATPNDGR